MKILLVVDQEKYSDNAAHEAARLAINTWSDVTILGVQPPMSDADVSSDERLSEAVCRFRQKFISEEKEVVSPYGAGKCDCLKQIHPRIWEMAPPSVPGKKQLRVLIRKGDLVDEILYQAREDESDFIVIGSSPTNEPEWLGEVDLPQKIANNAPCSVLVVKEEKMPNAVVCCLDQEHVSQESLEMINQVVTLHQADLKIVGLTGPKGLPGKGEVERKMDEILQYYTARKINTLIKLVDNDDLEEYVGHATKEGLIALWMGRKSLLSKIFSKDLVGKLVATSNSSVLILR